MSPWTISLALVISAFLASWVVHAAIYRLSMHLLSRREEYWRALLRQTKGPARLTLTILALTGAVVSAPLDPRHEAVAGHLLLIGIILCLVWVVRTAMDIWLSMHLRRYRTDVADNLAARKHVTQSRILQRVADTLLLVLGAGAVTMTFEGARQIGISILASAGAAGIVLGFALQPIMRNLFAGIQLAITQPIRMDDAVIVQGEWGNIEEISSSYVVIRIWDKRRLVVPLTYFIEQPFENWTREDATLIGTVMIYLDYSVRVEDIRETVAAFLNQNPLWDRDVFAVQVTDFREFVMEIRILATASSAPRVFDLRCEIREHLARYLQETYPESLPRLRGSFEMASTEK
ncbi:small-conductance mechanosensitive channel [Roseinatronobacter thiooxidans]|uniref:Small-conductance mechanosensitive channel n=1 Tax=Roseinatronobacter thiooxidans TaxID=121821 RepID=A0A2W7QCW9_9RHOB|nr:mechanosensitive ion channel domain-containing protein [Roseinatronobacter thiooxidans]PZX41927.1 small-conductance mechanosensitive channel [Roseinatronobacter thiooxidans]